MNRRRLAAAGACIALASGCGSTGSDTVIFGASPDGGGRSSDAGASAAPDGGGPGALHNADAARDATGPVCATGSLDSTGCSCGSPGATQPCYPGPAGSEDKGTCHAGSQTCFAQGEFATWGACTGAVVPAPEDCAAGKDTNCNGLVGCDDSTCPGLTGCCMSGTTRPCYDGPSGTVGVGACHGGAQVCDSTGAWEACTGEALPGDESGHCDDGIDNDCDGLADCKDPDCFLDPHCLFGCTANSTKACYTGPSGTEGVGPCTGGMETCKANGSGYGPCAGEVLPGSEAANCADGVDNDCNGVADCDDGACASAPACCTPSGGPPVDGTIWAHSSDTLYHVDPSTFAVTTVGSFGISDMMTDIALTPGGDLYGISFTNLYAIDKATAAATLIAPVPGVGNNSLTFLPNGNLLAADGTGNLKTIDPSTGQTTHLGNYGDGLIAEGDLVAVGNGTMFGVSSTSAGGGSATNSNILLRVNTTTGVATPVGPTGFGSIWGFAFSNGHVIGFTNGGQIIQIDPQTGAGTLISQKSIMFWGATQSPLVVSNPCQ